MKFILINTTVEFHVMCTKLQTIARSVVAAMLIARRRQADTDASVLTIILTWFTVKEGCPSVVPTPLTTPPPSRMDMVMSGAARPQRGVANISSSSSAGDGMSGRSDGIALERLFPLPPLRCACSFAAVIWRCVWLRGVWRLTSVCGGSR